MQTLPQLYKPTKTGKIQTCIITITDDTYTTTYGALDGKMQTQTTTCSPKNVGRSNATTGSEQAIAEAKAKHQLKIDKGYSLHAIAPTTTKLPQKVKTFQDLFTDDIVSPTTFKSKKIKENLIFPCYVEVKLNGINGEYRIIEKDTKLSLGLTSRGGKAFPLIEHQIQPVLQVMNNFGLDSINHEQYTHGVPLQDIQSSVTKTNAGTPLLSAHIFELPTHPGTYEEKVDLRVRIGQYIIENNLGYAIANCVPIKVNSLAEIQDYYNSAIANNFEGIIITNARSTYTYNERSSDVWKYKPTLDAEYEVVDFKWDKHSHVVYQCSTPEGNLFYVKRKGTAEERLADAAIATQNIGRFLTVEYETLSKAPALIPLKPVGLNFRPMSATGQPLI